MNHEKADSFESSFPVEALAPFKEIMVSSGLQELEIRDGDHYLKLARAQARFSKGWAPAGMDRRAAAAEVPIQKEVVEPPTPGLTIASPLGGVFYRSPSPQSSAFVKEGDTVAFGDVLCIVEAMKVLNEIRADRPCLIGKILVENGKPVSAGQDLFAISPVG